LSKPCKSFGSRLRLMLESSHFLALIGVEFC
jgi:hypothetical protein